jgi:Ca2+-binding RTX toxin-like protein
MINGTEDDDVLVGSEGNDIINGLGGNDLIFGDIGNDTIDGGAGNDELFGEVGDDVLMGGEGDDVLDGGLGSDALSGGAGNDTYLIDRLTDTVTEAANQGDDTVQVNGNFSYTLGDHLEGLILNSDAAVNGTGNAGHNVIIGGGGGNTLLGLAGNDLLRGRDGNDNINGGIGNDTLFGDGGSDQLTGGIGSDRFVFEEPAVAGADTITDFSVADDVIVLSLEPTSPGLNFMDGNLTADAFITADQFHVGAAAADASDRLIYNTTNGQLWFDADGTGNAGAVLLATMEAGLTLTHNNIYAAQDLDKLSTLTPQTPEPEIPQPTESDDILSGSSGSDTIAGLGGNDRITGLGGDDQLNGGTGNDVLLGGAGNDRLVGGADNDRLLGDTGRDSLVGQSGNDLLNGGADRDVLNGGTGNDRLIGHLGNDIITTGAGRDRIVIRSGHGLDRVRDFQNGFDRIDLVGIQFEQLTIQQRQSNVMISLGRENLLVLNNTTVADINAADFV